MLQKLLGVDAPANKVQEVKNDSYEHLKILHRNDGMVMYDPPTSSNDKKSVFEIVLHRPYSELNVSYRYVIKLLLNNNCLKYNHAQVDYIITFSIFNCIFNHCEKNNNNYMHAF